MSRPRVCAAIMKDDRILMVLHEHGDQSYWTLPGGAVEAGETLEAAVLREVREEVSLIGTVERLLFEGTYAYGSEHCFLVRVDDGEDTRLGHDPELASSDQILKGLAWFSLAEMKDDRQVKRVIQSLSVPRSWWIGAAAVCVNADSRLLMVLQGKPEEEKRWSVPSGGVEPGETLEQCCMREVFEETGYKCKVIKKIEEKTGSHGIVDYHVTYFEAEIVDGTPTIQDPDGLIHDIGWKSEEQMKALPLSFPEDREFLLSYLEGRCREIN